MDKGRVRFMMSATRPRGPVYGSRSFRVSPRESMTYLRKSIGSGASIGNRAVSQASTSMTSTSRRSAWALPSGASHRRSTSASASACSASVRIGFSSMAGVLLDGFSVDLVVLVENMGQTRFSPLSQWLMELNQPRCEGALIAQAPTTVALALMDSEGEGVPGHLVLLVHA